MAAEVRYVEEAEMFFQAWKQGLVSEQFITTLWNELDGLSRDASFGSYRQAASDMCKYLTSRVGAERPDVDPPANARHPRMGAIAISRGIRNG